MSEDNMANSLQFSKFRFAVDFTIRDRYKLRGRYIMKCLTKSGGGKFGAPSDSGISLASQICLSPREGLI